MNDVLLIVLLIVGFCTVLLVIAWVQEGREMERKKAAKRAKQEAKQARLAAAAAAHGGEASSHRNWTMGSFKIKFVCVVPGHSLNSDWSNPMQKIYADPPRGNHDFYIDNMPGKQFGFFGDSRAHPGFDWIPHVGKTVHGATVIEHERFLWLNKASD